jgi:PleD family two-component response regulator
VAAGLPAVTASYGVVEVAHVDELAAVLSRADAALFQAKREGRDRIVVHGGAGAPAPAVLESLTVVR